MSKAHINSLLQTLRTPLTCDSNTSFLLSPLSDDMYSDNGIAPLTNITTFRQGEGKINNAVAVEESTTNLVPSPTIFSSGWNSYSNGNSGSFVTEFGVEGLNIINKQSWCGASKSITLPAAGTYTLSVYVKVLSRSDTSVQATLYTSGGGISDTSVYASWSSDKIGRWQRISMTKTYTTTNITLFLICFGGVNDPAYTISVQYCMPLIEQKTFATSFVNGTRQSGELTYNANMTVPWTLSFWLNPQVPDSYSTNVNWVLSETPYSNNFLMWKRTTETYYRVRINGYDYTFAVGDIPQNSWSYIVITTDGTKTEIYLNGEYKGVINYVISITNISFGMAPGSITGNNLFNNIRIDNIYQSSQEIKQWYLSQSPFYYSENNAAFS